jgi:hypothetical protein
MKLSQHHASEIVKLLLVGDSGSGKTGALAALANAGYNLNIADFDNGSDILHSFVKPEAYDRINIEVLTDKMGIAADGSPIPIGEPTAWKRFANLLKDWTDSTSKEKFGPITSWGPDRVLVVDSATLMGRAAMHYVKHVNNATLERDWGYYGPVMELEEKLLELVFSQQVACNVIITAHIVSISEKQKINKPDSKGEDRLVSVDVGEPKAFPSFMGNKLPPKVGRYFNTVLQTKSFGANRKIITRTSEDIELKTTIPNIVPASLDLENGLATYFKLVKDNANKNKPKDKP